LIVGISMGDPSGIGPEVLAQALARPRVRAALTPLVFGDASLVERFPLFRRFDLVAPEALASRVQRPTLCPVSFLPSGARVPGKPSRAGGRAQYAYVEALIGAAKAGLVDALCTAPVSKEQISRSGIPFMGHTEVLAQAFNREVLMLMDGPRLRVALATNHLPIVQVPRALTKAKLVAQLVLLHQSLSPVLGRAPHVAVCGLNPHAGEGGLLGKEEVRVIGPALALAGRRGVSCSGPHAADGLFSQGGTTRFDVALVMYHDQGLVPAKALDFERTVNVTLGLPVVRTSPDHGTAYGIAGTGKASGVPMEEALLRAATLASARPKAVSRPKRLRRPRRGASVQAL
jgi:4-hydroxythreonine-4-phosphate dehydrogenase